MSPLVLALQVAAALNVPCVGTVRTGPVGLAMPEENGAPFEIVFRVDMSAGTWCADACEASQPIVSVEDDVILLRDEHSPSGSHVVMLSPSTGRFADTLIDGDTATLRSGSCRRVGFSNVPDRIA